MEFFWCRRIEHRNRRWRNLKSVEEHVLLWSMFGDYVTRKWFVVSRR